MKKIRLDQLVYDLGLTESRERAKTTIMSGCVFVNGQRADKPGMSVMPDAQVEVRGNALPFVSRGGFKLDKALKVFPIDVKDKVCIDCGASTGGFTDVLLQNGAKKVYAVDVGYGQLAWKLRNDERVVNLERTNLRYVTDEQIPELLDLAVMDVSFISVKLVLPADSLLELQAFRVMTETDEDGNKTIIRDLSGYSEEELEGENAEKYAGHLLAGDISVNKGARIQNNTLDSLVASIIVAISVAVIIFFSRLIKTSLIYYFIY